MGRTCGRCSSTWCLFFLVGYDAYQNRNAVSTKQTTALHLGGTFTALSGTGGNTERPRGCAALAALRAAARGCLESPAPVSSFRIPSQNTVKVLHLCRAFLLQARGSVLPGGPAGPAPQPQHRPGAAEGRQGHLAAGEIPPEEGAVVKNFPKLSSGLSSPLSVRGWGSGEKQTKSCLQMQKLCF